MKLITFDVGQGPRLGVLEGDYIIDLAESSQNNLPSDMRTFLELGEAGPESAQPIVDAALAVGKTISVTRAKLMAPILNPSKIVAIGQNYMDHCREQNVDPPKAPIIFTKFTTSIIGPGEIIRWEPELTHKVDHEGELAVVIGRAARRVSEEKALNYVAGYLNGNDVSARDLQFGDRQWVRGKSLDSFCPLGPYILTKDKVSDPHDLSIQCTVNGEIRQESNTGEMIFDIPTLIAYCSRAFTLLPGDVIMTGTPSGVGVFRTPPIFLKDGDEVSVEIEGLGKLSNLCLEERG